MRIVQITPGAGRMYCGNCLRDNALVSAWRRLGHDAMMVPVYLPLTLDEPEASKGSPIFFSGLNVYLDQKLPWFRKASGKMRHWLSSPALLGLAGRFAVRTRPEKVGDLTLSMLRGEEGNQARDLEEMIGWLRAGARPDVVCLSNALLLGMVRRLKRDVGAKIVCYLGGEDTYIDAMPEPWRGRIWETLIERGREVDMFVAPSRFYASGMLGRMKMPEDSLRVIGPGIDLSDYPADPAVVRSYAGVQPPVLGFFARMSPEKGLDKLVEAYIALRQSGLQPNLKLVIGGSYSPADASFVRRLQKQLGAFGLLGDVEFRPNVDRNTKIRLLQSMTVFSVPVRYREAFGMYLLEAMAAGVPVVQPPTNAFPEIIEDTGGGVICESDDTPSLAKAIQQVLEDADLRRKLAANGHRAVREKYDVNVIARCYIEAFG